MENNTPNTISLNETLEEVDEENDDEEDDDEEDTDCDSRRICSDFAT
jgi:hypothetical protein